MTKHKFGAEHSTEVFINPENGISIRQDDENDEPVIVFSSKRRAVEVAKAILFLAKVATFENEER